MPCKLYAPPHPHWIDRFRKAPSGTHEWYSIGTRGLLEGYSRVTLGVLEGYWTSLISQLIDKLKVAEASLEDLERDDESVCWSKLDVEI